MEVLEMFDGAVSMGILGVGSRGGKVEGFTGELGTLTEYEGALTEYGGA